MAYLVRLFFAALFSGAFAFGTLAALSAARVWQRVEAFSADPQFTDGAWPPMLWLDETVRAMQGGSAVFIGSAVAGVLLSEVFGTRSILYYMAAAGALSVLLASGLTPVGFQTVKAGSSAIAIAGFAGGAVYWLVNGKPRLT
jgi:hypothetical protein